MSDQRWGAPLTGAQMKLLRAAGLRDFEVVQDKWGGIGGASHFSFAFDGYRMRPNHPAYTLLEAGWLDGRNVRLWFGGDEAPDDWLKGSKLLLSNGEQISSRFIIADDWTNGRHGHWDIIAYIAKVEARTSPDTHSDRSIGRGLPDFEQPETVTIAKMTEAAVWEAYRDAGCSLMAFVDNLGLIKPEPTLEQVLCTNSKEVSTATGFLDKAKALLAQRGKDYDSPEGERSMGKTIAAFNAITGRGLEETDGWLLMALLKMVRQETSAGFHADSAEDLIAYAALAAEAGSRDHE